MEVIIYLESPKGQLMQVEYETYMNYWRLIGWSLQGEAPLLPRFVREKPLALQAGLV